GFEFLDFVWFLLFVICDLRVEVPVSQQPLLYRFRARLHQGAGKVIDARSGRELAIGLALTVVAGLLVVYGGLLPRGFLFVLWGLWAVASIIVVGLGWLKLFGPLLMYDLVCIARRRRYLLIRTAYAVTLLLLLAALYSYWFWNVPRGQNPAGRELTRFAETFFFTFMCAEFVAILVLTPAYTAGAIAEEKDKSTLEFLLATDLSKREIVLSKLA